jgi:choice-of-anchor B domain-containing protein
MYLRNYMRILFLLLLTPFVLIAQNDHFNITQLSHYNDTNIQPVDGDQIWSDVIGWKDTLKNREYMIAGSTDSLYFFDLTIPTQLVKCDVETGRSRNAINRDYEIYDHYVYCVSDKTSPLGSLQIFDLQYLPDSVHKVYDNDTFSVNTHTLFIEAKSKRLYLCGNQPKPSGNRSMAILSLQNPEEPTYLGELDKTQGCGYTHEVFVQGDTAYCSCGNDGLFIYDLRNPLQTILVGSITGIYPGNGYNHSSWLDSSNRYLMFTDENQGSPIKVYDLKQLDAPDIKTFFNSNSQALPHNAYWKGRFAYASMYEDGVYIFDMQHIASMSPNNTPPIAGFFDTYPKNPIGIYNGFHGCWGVWPFLPSGVLLASDISEGLFVLQPSIALGNIEQESTILYSSVSPNPFSAQTTITIQSSQANSAFINVYSLQGQLLLSQTEQITYGENKIILRNLDSLPDGLMLLTIQSAHSIIHKPILKIK